MECPKCQAEITEAAKFCSDCGCDLRKVTAAPAEAYRHPQSYTPKFLADKILTTRSAIEGERKLVTVLFADVANYTAMAEQLDPEEAHQIMDGCFRILLDEIHECHGTINQFTGDGIMALFGAPLALEDHAQRACHAALAIQQGMKRFGEELDKKFGLEFKMRVGLNSGPVIVGAIGDDLRMDYTAVGDTTNLAARMEGMAEPATVLVSPNTYNEVSQQFEFKPLGTVQVKGKKRPLEVYELIKEKVYRPRLGLERMIYSEMVGRDKKLDMLKHQVQKAADGAGSIVNIMGEAGIGKSRLVAELKNCDVIKKVALFEGRAISTGRNLSFHPIIDLLKQWGRIGEDDSETAAFRKLETAIKRVYPEELDEVLPFVATLMGMKLSGRHAERVKGIEGEALEKLIMKNVRALLTKATELNPLVIVTEDLHWADTSSIELMESLFRLAETQRVLFINVFRPGSKETGDRIVETIKERYPAYYVEIMLEPLDERMSEALIDNMLNIRGLHHALIDQIVQRSGGNPFFIEEVVRSFIDEGAVVVKGDGFEVTEKIEQMVIPHTINDVLMARIDRLDEKTRDLVKVASVIGRSFFYRILKEMTKTIEDIDSRLSYLKEIQLIRERMRMKELEYLFKHALAQEAAYESILVQKRKEIHLKVAECIEKVFKERLHEFYGMVAFHYSNGEDLDKAEEYLIKAGEESLRSSASSEALHYFRQALKLYQKKYGDAVDIDKIAMLEKNIALALYNRGECAEAVKYFDKTLAYYGMKTPKNWILALIKFFSGLLHVLIGLYLPFLKWKTIPTQKDSEIIINIAAKKTDALGDTDPKRFFIETFFVMKRFTQLDLIKMETGAGIFSQLSILFSWTGISFRLSRKILDLFKEKFTKSDVKSKFRYAVSTLFHNYLTGDLAIEYDDNLVNINVRFGEIFWVSLYLLNTGLINIDRGIFSVAKMMVDKLDEIANEYENDFSRINKYVLNAKLLMKYRKLNNALIELKEGIDFANKVGFEPMCFLLYSFKARIYIMMGNIKEAENSLRYMNKIKSEINLFPDQMSSFLLSQFMFDVYQLKKAINTKNKSELTRKRKKAFKLGKKAVRISRKVAHDRTEAYKIMGIYYWLVNKQKKALTLWVKSTKEGERLGARLELSRTYMEVGKHLLEPKSKYKELNGISAEGYLDKARGIFQEMDLQWDLDELEKVRK